MHAVHLMALLLMAIRQDYPALCNCVSQQHLLHQPITGGYSDLLCVLQQLELAVPGTYIAGEPVVTIAAFAPQLHVITSKQRPRKLTIHGSDGAEYMFLLKAGPCQPRTHCIPLFAGIANAAIRLQPLWMVLLIMCC